MNRTQIAALYDSFPESQQDLPREEFIRKTLGCLNPDKNTKILDAMVQRKHTGRMQQTQIDRAMEGGPS